MSKTAGKKLLIVESPAKAKTISKYIGKEYTVKASVGHIRDLPKSSKNAVDIEAGFVPSYVITPGKEKIVSEIKSLAEKADEVLLATDPDREGEAIAWHIKELIQSSNSKDQKSNKKIQRVSYNEITKEAIQEALEHPREIDINLKEAQEARRVLDRLVGYDLSGLIWKKVRYGLSAGRVQSPALRIIMEREREIRAFIPEDYWIITANLETEKKDKITVTCDEEPREEKETNRIIDVAKAGSWRVKEVKESKAKRRPRPPFITSTLQQAASSRLGFAPSRTMRIAQRLYEAGHITYMRTDSTNLSVQAIGQAKAVVLKEFGEEYYESRVYAKKSKNAQEAHEAIRPSNLGVKNAGLNEEQEKLYRLIWSRTIASQMKDAEVLRTKIITQASESIPTFSVNGSRILFDGWLKADSAAKGEDVILPEVKENDPLTLKDIASEAKQTQPPSHYSEAGLVKELEKRGIGRPSTYASIIQTLEDRGYVTVENKALIPTDTGDVVSTFLEQNFEKYISDSFTAEMEDELDEIAQGKRTYLKTLSDFYGPFSKDVGAKEDIPKLTDLGEAEDHHKCPKCGAGMVIKLGRGGKFLSCSRYPECEGALTIEGKEIKQDEPLGKDPESGEDIYLLVGRFGPYVQVGKLEKGSKKKGVKPRRASVPKDKNPEEISLEDALKYLSLPRTLGQHPDTGKDIVANVGRFGPYIAHNTDPKPDFRSLKEDDPYTVTHQRALDILAEPKKTRGFRKKEKEK